MFGCSCGHIVQDRQKAEELNTVQQKACVQQHSLESERVAFVHASNKVSHCTAYAHTAGIGSMRYPPLAPVHRHPRISQDDREGLMPQAAMSERPSKRARALALVHRHPHTRHTDQEGLRPRTEAVPRPRTRRHAQHKPMFAAPFAQNPRPDCTQPASAISNFGLPRLRLNANADAVCPWRCPLTD